MERAPGINEKVMGWMSRAGDLILLNLLMLVCALPVITLGTSVTAAYDVCLRMARREDPSVVRGFFRAFRGNFRGSFRLWLLGLFVLAVCWGDVAIGERYPALAQIGRVAAGVQLAAVVFLAVYAFPLQARYENTLGGTLRNSAIFALCRLPHTLLMAGIALSPALIFLPGLPARVLAAMAALLFILWPALCVYWNAKIVNKLFFRQFEQERQTQTTHI